MSTLTGKRPISVVIFDRTQAGLSDVPVFAQQLKVKVNTPTPREIFDDQLSPVAIKILEEIQQKELRADTALRADSSGGQTGEFAQSTESDSTQSPVVSLQEDGFVKQDTIDSESSSMPTENLIVDDPSLIALPPTEIDLDTIIHELETIPVCIPTVTIAPTRHHLLRTTHRFGIIDRVVLPAQRASLVSHYIEKSIFTWRRFVRDLRIRLPIFLAFMQTRIDTLQRAAHGFIANVKQIQRPQLPTVRLPSIRIQMQSPVQIDRDAVRKRLMEFWALFRLPEFNFARLTSKVLIAGSLVLMLLTVGPMVALELQSLAQKISNGFSTISSRADEGESAIQDTKPTPIPSANPDPEKQFQIIIPKIGVNSKVIANVDAGNEKDYDAALKKGIAHAAGTGLPGEENSQNKTVFLFGHSTNGEWNIAKYNALFYALKDMVVDDTFSIWFWGREFHYKVTETKIVEANDVSFLTPQTDKERIILQTCWPPGTSWKRFLVIAEPVR